jgi:enamine deaminase RidA (YjgF/YER057c/UK114 family)
MKKAFSNPKDLPSWRDSFSQIVEVRLAGFRQIFLSGQVAVDSNQRLVGGKNLKKQAEKAFDNVRVALGHARADARDVVKVTIYVKNYRQSYAVTIRKAFRKVFPHPELPAANWIGVQSLAVPGALIEVEVTAIAL